MWELTSPDPTNDNRYDCWTLETRKIWYQLVLKARSSPGARPSTDRSRYSVEFYDEHFTGNMSEFVTACRWHAANATEPGYDEFYSIPFDPAEAHMHEDMRSAPRMRWARVRMFVLRRRIVRYWRMRVATTMK